MKALDKESRSRAQRPPGHLALILLVIVFTTSLVVDFCMAQGVPVRANNLQEYRPISKEPVPPALTDIRMLKKAQRQLDQEYRTGRPVDEEVARFLGRSTAPGRGFIPFKTK
jgi:hypothetical protein